MLPRLTTVVVVPSSSSSISTATSPPPLAQLTEFQQPFCHLHLKWRALVLSMIGGLLCAKPTLMSLLVFVLLLLWGDYQEHFSQFHEGNDCVCLFVRLPASSLPWPIASLYLYGEDGVLDPDFFYPPPLGVNIKQEVDEDAPSSVTATESLSPIDNGPPSPVICWW